MVFLNENYPNPFNPSTNISYRLPKKSSVNLSVYDSLGKKSTLVNNVHPAGTYNIEFNAKNFASGYIFAL